MKVLFLDFDGVLNSESWYKYEDRRKVKGGATLSPLACSNLQYILDQDAGIKLVISSTWRKNNNLAGLRNILTAYGVNGSKVLGVTPSVISGDRAQEINLWLEANPNVTKFVILDDDQDVLAVKDPRGHTFITTPEDGLLYKQAKAIAKLFRGEK